MVAGTRGKFACQACGKSLVWKPEQVGKRVKCSCGAVSTVPAAPLAAAVAAAAPVRAKTLAPPPPTAQVAAPTLPYVAPRKSIADSGELPFDKLVDPVRDIYVPTGMLVFGFIAIALWALVGRGISAQMSMLVLAASCVSTMIKTILLVGACVAITSKHGEVSFGTLWTAVLKFSAIVLINDAMLIWFEAWQIYRGAIEIRHGVMYIDIWLLVWELFMAAFLIAVLLWYLFDIEKEQMFWIASPIAFASMAIGFLLRWGVVSAVNAYAAATAPPPPAPPPPPPPTTAPAMIVPTTKPATKPVIPETPRDKAIRERIEKGELEHAWGYAPKNGTQRSLFKKLFEAKPRNLYVEYRSFLAPKLYIELPKDEYNRGACFLAYKEYCQDGGGTEIDPVEAKDVGQRFIVFPLFK